MKQLITRYSALLCAFLASLTLSAQEYVTTSDPTDVTVVYENTGAISAVNGEQLYKIDNANLSNTFAGAFSGLTVMQGSGELGNNTAKWMIRGLGSYGVAGWSTAKIFVDGFEVNKEYMTAISPAEIETVEVLKDAAAVALYGEKGANGVIRITTRRGREGAATVNARVRFGVQAPTIINKPLGSYEFASLYNQAVSNDKGMVWSPAYSPDQLSAYKNGTGVNVDWYDQAMRSFGTFRDADVILNGGSKDARYNINLDYLGNDGLLAAKNTDQTKNLGYNRFNLRANLDFNVLKIFEVRFDMGGRIELLHRPNYAVSSLFTNLAKYPANIYNVFDDAEKEHLSGTAVYPNTLTGFAPFGTRFCGDSRTGRRRFERIWIIF